MRREVLSHLGRALGHTLNQDTIHWCITAPASWTTATKAQLRLAAFQAGMCRHANDGRVHVVSGPQAGAQYTLTKFMSQQHQARRCITSLLGGPRPKPFDICSGDLLVVVDAGSAKMDVTVHEVQVVARAGGEEEVVGGGHGGGWWGAAWLP